MIWINMVWVQINLVFVFVIEVVVFIEGTVEIVVIAVMICHTMHLMVWRLVMETMWVWVGLVLRDACMSVKCMIDYFTIFVLLDEVKLFLCVDILMRMCLMLVMLTPRVVLLLPIMNWLMEHLVVSQMMLIVSSMMHVVEVVEVRIVVIMVVFGCSLLVGKLKQMILVHMVCLLRIMETSVRLANIAVCPLRFI